MGRPGIAAGQSATVPDCPAMIGHCPATIADGAAAVADCPAVVAERPATFGHCPATILYCPGTVADCPAIIGHCPATAADCSGIVAERLGTIENRCFSEKTSKKCKNHPAGPVWIEISDGLGRRSNESRSDGRQ